MALEDHIVAWTRSPSSSINLFVLELGWSNLETALKVIINNFI
jgi:hypothetical protein